MSPRAARVVRCGARSAVRSAASGALPSGGCQEAAERPGPHAGAAAQVPAPSAGHDRAGLVGDHHELRPIAGSAPATHATLSTPGALRAVVGSGLYVCVVGLVGLGLGLLVRHTAGAIGAFAGVLLILPIVVSALPTSIVDAVQRYLPLQIGRAMISVQPVSAAGAVQRHVAAHAHLLSVGGTPTFSPWVGFGILCAYAVALLAAGTVLLVRRDA